MAIADADVKAIIDTTRDTTPFIETASLLVTDILGSTLSQARLDKIILYLAAHFVWITESFGLVARTKGDMTEEYRLRGEIVTNGFAQSPYGKTALSLDTTGKLAAAAANNGLKAQFKVYADRQNWRNTWPQSSFWWV